MLIIFAAIQNKENRSRLEALYEEHASRMYKVAYRILNDEHLAQDAVQEAFINISKNLEKIIGTDCNKIRGLFVIIVRNVSIDIYRLRKKQYSVSIEEIEEDLPESGPSVEEILMNNEAFTRVAEQAFALGTNQVTNSERGPLWVSITEFTNSFEISGSGLAQLDTSLYARSNINKVVINAGIQQYINGSWQTVKSWTSTSYSNSGYLNQKWYVVSGYNYRLVSTGAVYQNDVLIEQTSYTGSSYWY